MLLLSGVYLMQCELPRIASTKSWVSPAAQAFNICLPLKQGRSLGFLKHTLLLKENKELKKYLHHGTLSRVHLPRLTGTIKIVLKRGYARAR